MEIKKYEVFEVSFTAPGSGKPFEVEFSAMFVAPDQTTKKVIGFYDGENTYKLRFMPETVGEYFFMTKSDFEALNNQTGSFSCVENNPENHGKVVVKDKLWLMYKDGTNYFEAGTTCYGWAYQNAELREQTLKTLSEGYFNKIRMCLFPKWYQFNRDEPELYPFEGTPGNLDYTKPNVRMFQRLDELICRLGDLGIEADLILFHPYDKNEWGFSNMSCEDDFAFLKYSVARFSAYRNVWWSLANEYDLFKRGYKAKKNAWEKIGRYVREQDPYGHMESIHFCFSPFDYKKPYLTHCSIQRTEIFVTAENTDEWIKKWGKPVVIDECSYEGNLSWNWGGISAQEMVRRFWEAAARGGYMGHGETYTNREEVLWWSKGGTLHGESAPRIRFLKEVMGKVDNLELVSNSKRGNFANARAERDTLLTYFGQYQPQKYELVLTKSAKYEIHILDTWNMKDEVLPGLYNGSVNIEMPGTPFCAILCIAKEKKPLEEIVFDEDTSFRDVAHKKGVKRFMRLMKIVGKLSHMESLLDVGLSMTVNVMAAVMSMTEAQKSQLFEGYKKIVNENKLIAGALLSMKAMKH